MHSFIQAYKDKKKNDLQEARAALSNKEALLQELQQKHQRLKRTIANQVGTLSVCDGCLWFVSDQISKTVRTLLGLATRHPRSHRSVHELIGIGIVVVVVVVCCCCYCCCCCCCCCCCRCWCHFFVRTFGCSFGRSFVCSHTFVGVQCSGVPEYVQRAITQARRAASRAKRQRFRAG